MYGGPVVRALVPLFWRMTRGMTLGVRAVVQDTAGAVLLVRHGYVEGWHFPGGGVEVGETMRTALERELLEETGLVAGGEPQLHGVFFNPKVGGRDHVAVFQIRSFERATTPVPGHEIAEQGFFAADALPPGTTEPTRRRLAEILEGAPRSEFW